MEFWRWFGRQIVTREIFILSAGPVGRWPVTLCQLGGIVCIVIEHADHYITSCARLLTHISEYIITAHGLSSGTASHDISPQDGADWTEKRRLSHTLDRISQIFDHRGYQASGDVYL